VTGGGRRAEGGGQRPAHSLLLARSTFPLLTQPRCLRICSRYQLQAGGSGAFHAGERIVAVEVGEDLLTRGSRTERRMTSSGGSSRSRLVGSDSHDDSKIS